MSTDTNTNKENHNEGEQYEKKDLINIGSHDLVVHETLKSRGQHRDINESDPG
jgi:hypothetical protein